MPKAAKPKEKLVAVGDIHGRDTWKKVVEQEKDFDTFVFVGDYFDNWPKAVKPLDILNNFRDILAFKRSRPADVKLLLGNHDYHYLPYVTHRYSGYNAHFAPTHTLLLAEALKNNEIQIAHLHQDLLFTHAGVTETWADRYKIKEYDVENNLNSLLYTNQHAYAFSDQPVKPWETNIDPSGDNKHQSPIWVRPHSLKLDTFGSFTHVIGHTTFDQIFSYGGNIVLLDAPKSGEYIVVEKGEMNIRSVH